MIYLGVAILAVFLSSIVFPLLKCFCNYIQSMLNLKIKYGQAEFTAFVANNGKGKFVVEGFKDNDD